jgi:hypothetical protein
MQWKRWHPIGSGTSDLAEQQNVLVVELDVAAALRAFAQPGQARLHSSKALLLPAASLMLSSPEAGSCSAAACCITFVHRDAWQQHCAQLWQPGQVADSAGGSPRESVDSQKQQFWMC